MERHRATDRQGSKATRGFAMLLFPGFPMMAFSSVVEPLRAANQFAGRPLYDVVVYSPGGSPARSSGGAWARRSRPSIQFTQVVNTITDVGEIAPLQRQLQASSLSSGA